MVDSIATHFTVDLSLPSSERKHCDLIALCLNTRNQVSSDDDVVFYNQPKHPRFSISIKPPHYLLYVDPQQFPASGTVLVLANLQPALMGMAKLPILLNAAGRYRKWSVPGGSPVVEICTLVATRPGQVTVSRRAGSHKAPLADVLGYFGVAVDDSGQPTITDQPILMQPIELPPITRMLTIEARLKRSAMDGQLLPSGLACIYITNNTKRIGIAWPWDDGLWQLHHTPVHWHREQDRQIITVFSNHLDDLNRLWVFLHTLHPGVDLHNGLDYCVVGVDGEPSHRLMTTPGRGRVLLLARLERQLRSVRLIPDLLPATDLAMLCKKRQIPLEQSSVR